MSKNTVIDEVLGEIKYNTTLKIDGVKYDVVDFQQLPHSSPGCRFAIYQSGSFIFDVEKLYTAWSNINKVKDIKELKERSIYIPGVGTVVGMFPPSLPL